MLAIVENVLENRSRKMGRKKVVEKWEGKISWNVVHHHQVEAKPRSGAKCNNMTLLRVWYL